MALATRGQRNYLCNTGNIYSYLVWDSSNAAYDGVFVVLSILWGWGIDKIIPDKFDIIGGIISLLGVLLREFFSFSLTDQCSFCFHKYLQQAQNTKGNRNFVSSLVGQLKCEIYDTIKNPWC